MECLTGEEEAWNDKSQRDHEDIEDDTSDIEFVTTEAEIILEKNLANSAFLHRRSLSEDLS